MRVKLTSIMTIIVVNSVLTSSARSPGMIEDRLVLPNLFDSIAKNDEKKNEAYREIVRRDIEDEKHAFDAIREELSMKKRGNIRTSRNSHQKSNVARVHTTQIKREITRQGHRDGEMNNMMRLPVAGDNFETCVHNNKIIVDKAPLIKKLLTTKRGINLITRPSGFGKSFFINMLECFFLNKKHLFKNTALYNETIPEYPWKEYAVVKINFAEYTGLPPETFERELHKKLIQISNEYDIQADNFTRTSIRYVMENLLRQLEEKGHETILLIDDYDSPYMHSVLAKDGNAKRMSSPLFDFYNAFKYHTSGYGRCKFGLITGRHRRPTDLLGNLFHSGPMDYIEELSLDPKYHDLLGFTKSEINQYYADVLHQNIETRRKIPSTTEIDTLMNEVHHNLTSWYNDYRFTADETKLYSPLSVVEFLSELPSEMKTKWADTSLDSRLMKAAIKQYPAEMIHLVVGEKCPRRVTASELSWVDFSKGELHFDDVIKILYQEGYLTIESTENTRTLRRKFDLKCTNKERRESLWESLRYALLTGEENWLKLLEQRDFQSFFSRMETCLPKQLRAENYDTLVSFCLSNGDLNKMIERVHMKSDGEWSQYVLENSQNVFIFEYKIKHTRPKKSWTALCKDEYRRNYRRKRERVLLLLCIAIELQELGDPTIVNWSVKGFAKNGSVIEEHHHPTAGKKLG